MLYVGQSVTCCKTKARVIENVCTRLCTRGGSGAGVLCLGVYCMQLMSKSFKIYISFYLFIFFFGYANTHAGALKLYQFEKNSIPINLRLNPSQLFHP